MNGPLPEESTRGIYEAPQSIEEKIGHQYTEQAHHFTSLCKRSCNLNRADDFLVLIRIVRMI